MAKKIPSLTQYEVDLICMSCRYCIGKHTISSNVHAANVIKNSYNKLSQQQRLEVCKAIRKELEQQPENQIWQDVANCLDYTTHDFCKVHNSDTGEIEHVEYFWSNRKTSWNTNEYQKIRKSVKEYVKNPTASYYINDIDIVEDDKKPIQIKKKQKTPKNIDIDLLDQI